ncbi:hypothetical protein AVEN_140945-1 [Araneus ventricosus]|uniref:Uncharacterized protein n=1 Tax=Araneus ventricosus TaxID=182803 RepID=A0A4Y2GAY4_ARAVE|nr:hypothetical protein AVEN_140945-1 [Araneus ventricosus]
MWKMRRHRSYNKGYGRGALLSCREKKSRKRAIFYCVPKEDICPTLDPATRDAERSNRLAGSILFGALFGFARTKAGRFYRSWRFVVARNVSTNLYYKQK